MSIQSGVNKLLYNVSQGVRRDRYNQTKKPGEPEAAVEQPKAEDVKPDIQKPEDVPVQEKYKYSRTDPRISDSIDRYEAAMQRMRERGQAALYQRQAFIKYRDELKKAWVQDFNKRRKGR